MDTLEVRGFDARRYAVRLWHGDELTLAGSWHIPGCWSGSGFLIETLRRIGIWRSGISRNIRDYLLNHTSLKREHARARPDFEPAHKGLGPCPTYFHHCAGAHTVRILILVRSTVVLRPLPCSLRCTKIQARKEAATAQLEVGARAPPGWQVPLRNPARSTQGNCPGPAGFPKLIGRDLS
jgi:hypothetical protein